MRWPWSDFTLTVCFFNVIYELTSLAKWLSVCLQTKWLWVPVLLQSFFFGSNRKLILNTWLLTCYSVFQNDKSSFNMSPHDFEFDIVKATSDGAYVNFILESYLSWLINNATGCLKLTVSIISLCCDFDRLQSKLMISIKTIITFCGDVLETGRRWPEKYLLQSQLYFLQQD